MPNACKSALIILLSLTWLLHGCAGVSPPPPLPETTALYQPIQATGQEQPLLLRYAPCFAVEGYQTDYNRIGAAAARAATLAKPQIFIDTSRPTLYTQVQKFTSGSNNYTNLIYRVHFPAVPSGHLTQGHNVGLLVYVTLNEHEEPILLTTLHTCGCYLALVPTSNLDRASWPANHSATSQEIFGEYLPGNLDLKQQLPGGRLVITLRSETHRVRDIRFMDEEQAGHLASLVAPLALAPMSALEELPLADGHVSFFEQDGWRKGYVKESQKPWERLFMGWWALDPLVGEDKALGPPEVTGVSMYTSLKFWSRQASNIWDFPTFLRYWGWKL